jgi:hypothetical protein
MSFPYNYINFLPAEIETNFTFNQSPALSQPAPDFPLWDLEGNETRLGEIWERFAYTIVEFGSFT